MKKLKKINLKATSEHLSDHELKNIRGGSTPNCSDGCSNQVCLTNIGEQGRCQSYFLPNSTANLCGCFKK